MEEIGQIVFQLIIELSRFPGALIIYLFSDKKRGVLTIAKNEPVISGLIGFSFWVISFLALYHFTH